MFYAYAARFDVMVNLDFFLVFYEDLRPCLVAKTFGFSEL